MNEFWCPDLLTYYIVIQHIPPVPLKASTLIR